MSKKLGKKRWLASHPEIIEDGLPLNTTDCQWNIPCPGDPPFEDDVEVLHDALALFEKLKNMKKEDFIDHAAQLHGVSPEKLKELAILKKKTMDRMSPPAPANQTFTGGASGMLFNTLGFVGNTLSTRHISALVNMSSSTSAYYPNNPQYGAFVTRTKEEDDY